MILSNLENTGRIESLNPLFKKLFDYVKTHDLLNAPLGKIVLDGDKLFINNNEIEGVKKEGQLLEIHRQYIDVHLVLAGKETIGWKSTETLQHETQAYDEVKDRSFFSDESTTYVDVLPGEFVIVYPEDAHAPSIGEGKIRKIVAKVLL
ncbi:MAG: YhcH/YjgK/YiaL family protein [Culturomica sp.]|jgi:YhcH/YjgK/YiaL family protein|nr:YhcH/YjgK/YiaL family protein [Culturomica sp.]